MTQGGSETLPWEALDGAQRAQALGRFDMHEGALSLHLYEVDPEGRVVGRRPVARDSARR